MSNEIMVSVCCLAYNHGKYIRKCLDGFVMQKTNFKFEILIHDDASTDDTADIIREYELKYPEIIKPIYQTENQHSKGIKVNQTYQYPRVRGKYIAWCEGDDYWIDEYKLQKQFDVMESHPECSICVHKVQVIKEDGTLGTGTYPRIGQTYSEGVLDEDVIGKAIWEEVYPFHTSSYFLKKEVVEEYRSLLKSDFLLLNGDEQILRLSMLKGKFYYLQEIMSHRRFGSIGSWNMRKSKWDALKRLQRVEKVIKGDLYFNQYSDKKFEKFIDRGVGNTLISGILMQPDYDEFRKYRFIAKKLFMDGNYQMKKKMLLLMWYINPKLMVFFQKKQQ